MPQTHEATAPLLWTAYSKSRPGAEQLFKEMFETSVEAQAAVFKNFYRGTNRTPELEKYEYTWVMYGLRTFDERLHCSVDHLWDDVIQAWSDESQVAASEAYVSNGWLTTKSHRFFEYLGALALTDPKQCLCWIQKGVEVNPEIMNDAYTNNKVVEILIQAYNGLSIFTTKEQDAEFAMNLLDDILKNNMNSTYLDNCIQSLDN